ncbi:class I SAM-dependent methyltransferase [Paenibacillus mendelii]|uniref:Methyltransferase domain-containing protein n=1 Tax=Paenibacillus mendelii TaxID=206163 RepID=A0ABV6J3L5_9BACL|nr:class I SAM-dependent methyltransferase [Paenibacillus mendelii]MCQ6563572.1 class I SAM-dependent methyltransferase [Paenibacillus mendelii]
MLTRNCRLCGHTLSHIFIDLGISPLANSYVSQARLHQMEPMYPLRTFVCEECFLVQAEDFESPQHIFSDYAYFSSYSDSWLAHCKRYADMITERCALTPDRQVIEIASNDGYLLQYFKEKGIPVLGIEPAANVAERANERGIPTSVEFFGQEAAASLLEQGKRADLLIGNNVLAHVPDLNDFVAGMKLLLADSGVITMEFPHLMRLIQEIQFDTIYHEHYSYFSLTAVERLFAKHDLIVFDVEQLETHGGSLRIYAAHRSRMGGAVSSSVIELLSQEETFGMTRIQTYADFKEKAVKVKRQLLRFLISLKESGKSVVGYGAPAKGNTLLNYCGIDRDYLDYTVDRSPHKQGLFLPGSRIPICEPDRLKETRPDYVLILPWNLKQEIMAQTEYIREWGGCWIIPVPEVEVIE